MLESLGNLGDFVGGIGVIVTVIYLAFQVRQSTASTKSASYQAVVSAISDWSRTIGADRDLSRIMRTGSESPKQLEVDEFAQFELLIVSVTRNFENVHYQYQCGGIPEVAWKGWSYRILSFYAPPGIQSWLEKHRHAYSPDFIRFIEDGWQEYADSPFSIGNQDSESGQTR